MKRIQPDRDTGSRVTVSLQVLLDGNCRAHLQLDYLQTGDTADKR